MSTAEQAARDLTVAEIQGLYGPFTFTERLLQKIWLRGEFDATRAVLEDGRTLRILHPGRWNLLGGPDFRDARLGLGECEQTGDVELHLNADDWAAHAHAADPAYDRVILHVVLFPCSAGGQARRLDGSLLPTLVLLPLLLHDLEEYAAEEAVETLANRADWCATEELARRPGIAVRALLQGHAEERWRQKVAFARRRLERLGWNEACHHAALEILGFRFNRVPMLRTAARAPLAAWGGGAIDVTGLLAAEAGAWSLQGVRPANHPRERLRQYAAWTRGRPDWPARLQQLAGEVPDFRAEAGTPAVRKVCRLASLRGRLADDVTAGAVVGTRLDNLVCDGFLPLLAARLQRSFFLAWYHWFAGDLPPRLQMSLKALALFDGRAQPACHGLAQGLLGWMLARDGGPAATGGAVPRPGEAGAAGTGAGHEVLKSATA